MAGNIIPSSPDGDDPKRAGRSSRRRRAAPKLVVLAPAEPSTLADLIDGLAKPHPDAALITAIDGLTNTLGEIENARRKGREAWVILASKTLAERDQLELAIARTPAQTPVGRLAKAALGLRLTPEAPISRVALSALKDFVRATGST